MKSSVAQCGFSIGSSDLTRIIFNTTTNTSHATEADS